MTLQDIELDRVRLYFAEEIRAVCNLQTSIANRNLFMVRRLRRDAHEPGPSFWFHGDGFCFFTEG